MPNCLLWWRITHWNTWSWCSQLYPTGIVRKLENTWWNIRCKQHRGVPVLSVSRKGSLCFDLRGCIWQDTIFWQLKDAGSERYPLLDPCAPFLHSHRHPLTKTPASTDVTWLLHAAVVVGTLLTGGYMQMNRIHVWDTWAKHSIGTRRPTRCLPTKQKYLWKYLVFK